MYLIQMDPWNKDYGSDHVAKRWYSYIADLLATHKLVVVMRDNADEIRSQVSISSSQ
jgi:hypothetical protein